MKPMEPMKPMQPMKPIASDPWWPSDLGEPSSTGAQNDMRYAFFPDKHRLLIERDGRRTLYDSADHKISGVAQQGGGERSVTFSSQHGPVKLGDLKAVG